MRTRLRQGQIIDYQKENKRSKKKGKKEERKEERREEGSKGKMVLRVIKQLVGSILILSVSV